MTPKKAERRPPPELLAEFRQAHAMVTFFDEKQPGVRTYWHELYDRLKLAIARYNKEEPSEKDREVTNG